MQAELSLDGGLHSGLQSLPLYHGVGKKYPSLSPIRDEDASLNVSRCCGSGDDGGNSCSDC